MLAIDKELSSPGGLTFAVPNLPYSIDSRHFSNQNQAATTTIVPPDFYVDDGVAYVILNTVRNAEEELDRGGAVKPHTFTGF